MSDKEDYQFEILQWLAAFVLHAEQVHGCNHTDQLRADLVIPGLNPKPPIHIHDYGATKIPCSTDHE